MVNVLKKRERELDDNIEDLKKRHQKKMDETEKLHASELFMNERNFKEKIRVLESTIEKLEGALEKERKSGRRSVLDIRSKGQ